MFKNTMFITKQWECLASERYLSIAKLWIVIFGLTTLLLACGGTSTSPEGPSGNENPTPPVTPEEPAPEEPPVQNPNPTAGKTFTEFTDPSCTDGRYQEVLPDLTVDIDKLIADINAIASPTAEQLATVQLAIFDAAYPYGSFILRESPGLHNIKNCAIELSNPNLLGRDVWPFTIHECGHFLDREFYHMSANYRLKVPDSDYYFRSELTKDRFHKDIPNAVANDTYFNTDAVAGNQGMQTMLDEWAQYIHSVAVDYLTYRFPSIRYTGDTPMMLNFAWATQRYWLWAKETRPDDFQAMMNDTDAREATLALWGQTWTYLDAFEANTQWQVSSAETQYLNAIRDPALLEMMNEIRKKHGCTGIN